MIPFARRLRVPSLLACGLLSICSGCHEEVPLGGWSDVPGTLTSGTGGAATVGTPAVTTASATTTGTATTDGGLGTGGSAGDMGVLPGLPECLAVATPGPVNPTGSEPDPKATETATDWTWPVAMRSLEWDVKVEREIVRPPGVEDPTSGYYYAHQFSFQGGNPGTFGIQAEGGYDEYPGQQFEFTKIATFWLSALDAELGDIPSPDARVGTYTVFGIEYLTIHARFAWEVCRTYRFRIAPHSSEADGSTWYGAWIVDVDAGVETLLG
ncbi:MAG TPA: hypothetical protein VFU02_03920, partial [Polyangiaceae bacterium]|nr:hypothetical protein [Polyangiaceae bacterium]